MRSYAQTYPQLINEIRSIGYSTDDLMLFRKSYELATTLFSGRFQPSGKSFIAHVVGTASVLARSRLPAPLVAAGLVHNAYTAGDFADGDNRLTLKRRCTIQTAVGPEVEKYVFVFQSLVWHGPQMKLVRADPSLLEASDRGALLLLIADHLEHLCDLDVAYYEAVVRTAYLNNSRIAIEVAESLGAGVLAVELRERLEQLAQTDLPVRLPPDRIAGGAFVIVPKSRRKRFAVRCRETFIRERKRLHGNIGRFRRLSGAVRRRTAALALHLRNIVRGMGVPNTAGYLQPKSKTFSSLFSDGGRIEKLATGFRFTEGPVWIAEEQCLLFSDIPANCIFCLKTDRSVEVYREPSGHSNGLTRDGQGRLITCEQGNRRVTRTEQDGSITVLASEFRGKRLNSPNDVVVKSDGSIYFSDPAYGVHPEQQEQPVEGVYRISADGKQVSLVAADFERPNGLAFSPDESVLYVDDSHRRHIVAFKVHADGSLYDRSFFHDMNVQTPGAPDGMKVDVEGRIYCTGAGGVWVFDAEGNRLGLIVTPEKPSNCAWGDNDRRSLYITALTSIYRIRVRTPGLQAPKDHSQA